MVAAVTEEIADFMRERAGAYLRSVAYYDEDEYDLLYVRDDIEDQYSRAEIEEVIEELRWEAFARYRQETLYVHGGLTCTVRCFEGAVEMNFAHGEMSGTAVALEPGAAHNLYTFVGECLDHVPTRAE